MHNLTGKDFPWLQRVLVHQLYDPVTDRTKQMHPNSYCSVAYKSTTCIESRTRIEADFSKRAVTQKQDLNRSIRASACMCTLHA